MPFIFDKMKERLCSTFSNIGGIFYANNRSDNRVYR